MKKNGIQRIAVICAAALAISSTFAACSPKKVSRPTGSSSQAASSGVSSSSEAVSSQAASAINLNSALDKAGGTKRAAESYAPPNYSASNSVFNDRSKIKETKISINNHNIVAPPIKPGSNGLSPIKRTIIEGVDGTFVDPKINEQVVDLKGEKFKFGTFWTGEWNGTSKNATDKWTSQVFKQLQTDYNCKISLVAMDPGNYLKTISNQRAAGNTYADIFELQMEMGDLFRTGNLQDLQTVKSIDFRGNQWNPVYSLCTSFKGKVYGVGLRYDHVEHDLMVFNQNLAKKYNLGDLYGFASSGKWTDNLFLQVSQRFAKLNTDKSIYTCQGLFPEKILDLVYSNYSSPFGITSSKYIFNGQDESVLDILNFAQDYVKAGMYDKTIAKGDWQTDGTFQSGTGDASYSMGAFEKGKSLFFLGSDTILPGNFYGQCKGFNYGILPMPKGPAADGYTMPIANCKYFSLLANGPQLEDAGKILVAIANRTNIPMSKVVENNRQVVYDQQSLDQLTKNYTYKQILNVGLCGSKLLPNIYAGAAIKAVIQQSETPKQAMDSIAVKAQTEVNTTFGQ